MGLGFFIAKTLLERTGAALTFANGPAGSSGDSQDGPRRPTGAIVEVVWSREALEVPREQTRGALGQNVPIRVEL